MHRELSHMGTTLPAPLELQGRTVKKTGQEAKSTLGKWENLIGNSVGQPTSPRSVANRCHDSEHAKRTIHPDCNKDVAQNKTRKIAEKEGGPDSGSLLQLFRKTGTVEEVHKSKKKYFKEIAQTEDTMAAKPEKKTFKSHSRKQGDLCSHISTLASPTYQNSKEAPEFKSPQSPTSANRMKRQEFLKSSISILPCGEDTKRPYQDKDEARMIQSAYAPKMARHLSTTFLHEPLFATSNKRNPNHQNHETYEDEHKMNPLTKGKKGAPPKLEINTNTAFPIHGSTYSPRYKGTEPLDPMFPGQRSVAARSPTNIISPASEKTAPRGQTVFSYRTFASQITF